MKALLRSLLVGAAGLMVAPAVAVASGPTWTDAQAGVPGTVDLQAVGAYSPGASSPDVVVAVGRDASTGTAAIYRYASGSWQQDTIQNGAPSDSCLVSVAVDQQAAWAVGSQGGGCPGSAGGSARSLLVRLDGTQAGKSGTAAWTQVAGAPFGPATSVSLNGSGGYVATGSQGLYSFTDGLTPAFTSVSFNSGPAASVSPTASPTINAVAGNGSGTAFAVGSQSDSGGVFSISSNTGSAAVMPQAPSTPLTRVAAISPSQAIAIDSQASDGWWAPDAAGVWEKHAALALDGTTLTGVALGADSTVAITAIDGQSGHGLILWGPLGQSFSKAALSCAALTGVSVVSANDMWAVGASGAVLHYATSTAPLAGCTPQQSIKPGGGSGGGQSGSGGSGSVSGSSSGSSPGAGGTSPSPGPSSGVAVTVVQPGSPPSTTKPTKPTRPTRGRPKHHKPRLLVHRVRVRVEHGRLVVSCRLSRPARVSAIALRSNRVVGRVGWHKFHSGSCHLVIPYSGSRPPAKLRIFALPISLPSRKQAP